MLFSEFCCTFVCDPGPEKCLIIEGELWSFWPSDFNDLNVRHLLMAVMVLWNECKMNKIRGKTGFQQGDISLHCLWLILNHVNMKIILSIKSQTAVSCSRTTQYYWIDHCTPHILELTIVDFIPVSTPAYTVLAIAFKYVHVYQYSGRKLEFCLKFWDLWEVWWWSPHDANPTQCNGR